MKKKTEICLNSVHLCKKFYANPFKHDMLRFRYVHIIFVMIRIHRFRDSVPVRKMHGCY